MINLIQKAAKVGLDASLKRLHLVPDDAIIDPRNLIADSTIISGPAIRHRIGSFMRNST